MHCRDGAKNGFTANRFEDGTFNYDLWVCSDCLQPTRTVFEKLTNRLTPHNAVGLMSVVGSEDGTQILRWRLKDKTIVSTMNYHPYPRKVDMAPGRAHLVKFWEELDTLIDSIRDDSGVANPHIEDYKIKATTYAEVLAELMHPFYADHTAVLQESMARWQARKEGIVRQTPGLAEAIWDPNTRFDGTPYSRESEAKVRTRSGGAPGKPIPAALDEQKKTFIKTMLSNGSMDATTLASMFEVSVEVIEAAASS